MNVYDQITWNKRKSILVVFGFLIVITILGYLLGFVWGDPFIGLGVAIVFSTIFALISFYSGDNMILTLSHAKPASKQKYPFLVNTVEGLAIAAGIPCPKIYVIEDTAINAFATGRNPERAAVTVTTGCLQRLNRTELEGVIAHEVSHIKNYDIRLMMLVTILIGIVALLSDFLLRSFWFGGGRRDNNQSGGLALILLAVAILMAILSPIIAHLMRMAVSRKREFLADASGALLTRHPAGLADALKKIRDDKEPLVEAANKATAHLFISNPLRRAKGRLNHLFSTHPDINERIKRLEAM